MLLAKARQQLMQRASMLHFINMQQLSSAEPSAVSVVCISLWNIQAVHGPIMVSVTEAGHCPCYLCLMETDQCHLGIISLRCPVYPLPLYTGTWSFHAGNLQDAAVSCNHHCADFYKLPKEERISASGEPWQLLLPRRSINEKSFTIPEYANKLRNRLNRWRVSIINVFVIETRHLFCRLSFFTEADNNF